MGEERKKRFPNIETIEASTEDEPEAQHTAEEARTENEPVQAQVGLRTINEVG